MNKIALGKARIEKLEKVINNLLSQDDESLVRLQESGLIKKDGTFSRGHLANAVGMDTEPATFRQNKKTMLPLIEMAEDAIKERIHIETDETKKTKETIGKETEEYFLAWLAAIGTEEHPAPMNYLCRLYKKALWAEYTKQDLLDVKQAPNWFNSRPKVKEALEELNVKVVQGSVVTQKMDAESISDDMENSMTSALVRKLRAEVKELKDKLESEIEARKEAELKAEQNAKFASQVPTGKMAH